MCPDDDFAEHIPKQSGPAFRVGSIVAFVDGETSHFLIHGRVHTAANHQHRVAMTVVRSRCVLIHRPSKLRLVNPTVSANAGPSNR